MLRLLRFVPVVLCACSPKAAPSRRLVFDFETDEGWSVDAGTAEAFPSGRKARVHRHGKKFLGTGETEDGKFDIQRKGRVRSPPIEVDHDYMVLRIGSYGTAKTCFLALRDADTNEVLEKVTPRGASKMVTHIWDVQDLRGDSVYLLLVDRHKDEKKACAVHLDYVRLVDG